MTETTETAPEDGPDAYGYPLHDPLLELLVRIANDSEEFALSVTLAVPGAVYTGDLIGFLQFQRLQVETMRGASGEGAESMASALESAWSRSNAQRPDDAPVNFFHLRGARLIDGAVFTPSGAPGLLVRGRLSQVGAWSLGGFASGE